MLPVIQDGSAAVVAGCCCCGCAVVVVVVVFVVTVVDGTGSDGNGNESQLVALCGKSQRYIYIYTQLAPELMLRRWVLFCVNTCCVRACACVRLFGAHLFLMSF